MRTGLALLLVLLVAGAPTALAGTATTATTHPNASTPTTLHFHLVGPHDFPINTQPVDPAYKATVRSGVATNSAECVPAPLGTPFDGRFHTVYGYVAPSEVSYAEGHHRPFHPLRGLQHDVRVDTTQPAVLRWFLETQATGADPGLPADPHAAPLLVPNVVVQVTVRTGVDVSVRDDAYNDGAVLARGRLGPALLHPSTADVPHHAVDGRHVYEFAVPIAFETDTLPHDEGFNVRIDTFVENPLCADPTYPEDAYLMPNLVAWHTSPALRPRLDLSNLNPLAVSYLHPQFIAGELVVHAEVASPWGPYDVDDSPTGLRLEVDGPSAAARLARAAEPHRYDGHILTDLQRTWIWPYQEDDARPGLYTVRLVARNDQGSAEAVATATFALGADACAPDVVCEPVPRDTPAPSFAPLVGLVGVLAVALRRRRRAGAPAPPPRACRT